MKTKLRPGYVSMLVVVSLSAIMLLMLTASYRFSIQSQQTQKKTQIRIDYTHREQAMLQAVLTEAPNRAMQAMMANSNGTSWQTKSRWRWIFEYARDKADGETALDDDIASVLGLSGSNISANTGDGSQGHIVTNVKPVTAQSASWMFYINAGTNNTGTSLGPGYPEDLSLSNPSATLLDRDRPIITTQKTYSGGEQYKSIPYPNVHFGYSTQGQNFVAKRNWWAFSIIYGSDSDHLTGVETVKKNYVLSIYEVPSQLALGSTATTYFGKHADGTAWQNVSIDGGVYASRATTEGSLSLSRLATRKGITLADSSAVGGVTHDAFTGELPTREGYEAANADFFPLSNSSDSGNVAFVAINRGEDAFDDLSNTSDVNSASPTGWNWYSRPAMQCAMKLRVEDVVSSTDQTPTMISFTYKMSGMDNTIYFTKGTDWPNEGSPEGDVFPFHLETTQSGRQGLTVYVDRLRDYLTTAGADSLTVNHSVAINANYRDNINISRPNIPTLDTDIALILRGTKDFTAFPKGFSLVTPFRLYLANDTNVVSTGTGPGGNPVYPPISLFAPEKRFGVRDQAISIDFEGQLNYIGKDGSQTVRPLDLISGVDEQVVGDNIEADLYSISDIGSLPPINQMNWLVVIEEVQ